MTGYDLSRAWFAWCFENPEKINTNHTALYFFCIDLCNRLDWKEKFGLPTDTAKEALGIKNYRTYKKTLDDLVEFGFIDMIEESKNQYSSTIIALVKNTKARTKAKPKQSTTTASITKPTKPINNTYSENEIELFTKFTAWVEKYTPRVNQLKEPITIDEYFEIKQHYSSNVVTKVLYGMQNKSDLLKKYVSANLTIRRWCENQKDDNVPVRSINNYQSTSAPLKKYIA